MHVGILTLFEGNINYGAMLQAYALAKVIGNAERVSDVKQIRYARANAPSPKTLKISKILHPIVLLKFVYRKLRRFFDCRRQRKCMLSKAHKKLSFDAFISAHIPHTSEVFCQNSISKLDEDVFVVGSDQVWNFDWYDSAFFLDFVPAGKYKMSYAAGMPDIEFSNEQKDILRISLSSFDAVSVREESSAQKLPPLIGKEVNLVLDPTLLLTEEEWDGVCSPRQIDEHYVFCYFLGALSIKRKDIVEFARKRRLKIVTMPYAASSSRKDGDFGDYRIYDAGPSEFLSYIKHAEYIFTDSFHGAVFSLIYKKEFCIFERMDGKGVNNRIQSLIQLFGIGPRFCDGQSKLGLPYIESLPKIDYERALDNFKEQRLQSIAYLNKCFDAAYNKTVVTKSAHQRADARK